MRTLSAHRYCRGSLSPQPPRAAIKAMQAELDERMAAIGGVCPVGLAVGAWRLAPGNPELVIMLTITVARGEMVGSLASWYEWQHPQWRWITSPLPLELARQETLLG